jgi:DNA-binding PadR family transcriptional regulator
MDAQKSDLLEGTLDMLVLKIVALGPSHGYAIAQRINQISRERNCLLSRTTGSV